MSYDEWLNYETEILRLILNFITQANFIGHQ